MSRHAPLDDATIWKAISCTEKRTRGCRWGEYTRFAVLDIDETSQYHNELGLARLRHTLAAVGLTSPQLYQSSASSGWHMYLFLSDWTETTELQETLTKLLRAEGFELRLGQLEVFPSKNGLRLPLQQGFAWLDEQATILIRREDITETEAVAKFLDALDANAHNWTQARNRIESRIEQIEIAAAASTRRELPNEAVEEDGFTAFFTKAGMVQEVYTFGREYWENGLTEPKQRHHAILCLGHYLWYGDEDNGVRALPGVARADQRAAKIRQWLTEKHNGYSDAVNRDAWDEIEKDIHRACNWEAASGNESQRAHYPLTDRAIDRLQGLTKKTGRLWYPEDFQKGNIGREEEAREKIRAGLVQLLEAGRRVSVRALESLSGCRRETIRRHVDIWGVFRLSNGLGDLSSVPPLPGVVSVESSSVSDTSLELVACAEVESLNQLPEFIQEQFENEPVKSSNKPLKDFCEDKVSENQPVFSMFLSPGNFSRNFGSADARILFSVFDSLRLKLFGATANNSTACETQTVVPSLPSSLATGSNTGALSAFAASAGGSSLGLAVSSLNGFLPAVAGPLHLPQTGLFSMAHSRALVTSRQGFCCAEDSFYGSSVRQSNRMWRQLFGEGELREIALAMHNPHYRQVCFVQDSIEDNVISFSDTPKTRPDVISHGANTRLTTKAQAALDKLVPVFIGSGDIVLGYVEVNFCKVMLCWFGEADLVAHFCLSSMNFCRTASRWAFSSSTETDSPRASDSSASSIARRSHCNFISSTSCACASGVKFSTSFRIWSKVVCSSGLR